jgi:hypothetical protein
MFRNKKTFLKKRSEKLNDYIMGGIVLSTFGIIIKRLELVILIVYNVN